MAKNKPSRGNAVNASTTEKLAKPGNARQREKRWDIQTDHRILVLYFFQKSRDLEQPCVCHGCSYRPEALVAYT